MTIVSQVNILLDDCMMEHTHTSFGGLQRMVKEDSSYQQHFTAFVTHPHSEPWYIRNLYIAYIMYFK